MKKCSIPRRLQPFLWSVDVAKLDLEKNKTYIIHQIFAYGDLPALKWLFKTYSKKTIIETFTLHPYKDYFRNRFHFIKNIILPLKNENMDERYYVKNTPRAIG